MRRPYTSHEGWRFLNYPFTPTAGSIPRIVLSATIATMSSKRSALRYVEADVLAERSPFGRGTRVRGHEFQYSRTRYLADRPAFAIDGEREGYARVGVHASYVHLHLGAYPTAVDAFLGAARSFGGAS